MKQLRKDGLSKRAIAKQLGVGRTSVIRVLRSRKRSWTIRHVPTVLSRFGSMPQVSLRLGPPLLLSRFPALFGRPLCNCKHYEAPAG
jgi:hypothetical protein